MRLFSNRIAILAGLLGLLAALWLFAGCNSFPDGGTTKETFDYRLTGALVKEMNLDSTRIVTDLERNQAKRGLSEIVFGTDTLTFDDPAFFIDSVYSFAVSPAVAYGLDTIPLAIVDSTVLDDSLIVNVPDTISINEIAPANHLVTGNGSVTLGFSASPDVIGYVVAAVLSGSEYTGAGWSEYTESFANSGTITPDAFLGPDGLNPVEGLYNVYVYAFNGAPDSVLTSRLLPVPLPTQLVDNIDHPVFTGHFGAIVVALKDTVRVQSQP